MNYLAMSDSSADPDLTVEEFEPQHAARRRENGAREGRARLNRMLAPGARTPSQTWRETRRLPWQPGVSQTDRSGVLSIG